MVDNLITSSNGREYEFTRINNDINGNPRYVVHFLSLGLTMKQYGNVPKLTSSAGLRKFHNKQYGGGYVFQSYNLKHEADYFDKIFFGGK